MKCLTACLQKIISKICGTGSTPNVELAKQPNTDDERLYRRIPNDSLMYSRSENGDLRLSASAFNCPEKKPSVNRAILRGDYESKLNPSDGVYVIIASDVRSIGTIKNEGALADEPAYYAVDVFPRPVFAGNPNNEAENISHAQIETNPGLKGGSRFKRLKEALALAANEKGYWAILPS